MSTAEKLAEALPCPHCGGRASRDQTTTGTLHWLDCNECGASSKPFPSPQEAVAWWNRRAQPAADGAQRVDLTDAQILAIAGTDEICSDAIISFARDVLAAAWGVKLDGEA